MFLRNCRLNNIAGHNDGTFELQLWILGMGSAGGPQLRHRPTALQDDHPLSGSLYAIEDSQTSSLEVGCVDGFHMTSIGDQSDRVKPNEVTPPLVKNWGLIYKARRMGRFDPAVWRAAESTPVSRVSAALTFAPGVSLGHRWIHSVS